MSNNPVTGKRSPSVSQNVHSEERASENLFCIYCSRSNGILGYAIIHLFQKEIYCTVLVSWSLAPVIMLAEGILTGIIYREKKQNKPHRCDINKKEKKETWKDHLVDRLATEDLATESKKQDKIIAKDSKKEHNKVLLPCKSTEELPAKEHNSAHVNGTMFTGLHIPEREHNNEKQLDLYRSWSCHSIYQNYPDLHIAGDHVGDYMLDSGCVMDDTCDELPDGPVLVSVDIPLGHSPPKEPLEKPTSKFLNGDEGTERSMTLHKQPLSNSVLNSYMDRKMEELYKQVFEENLTRCGSVTNLQTSSLIMNNLNLLSLQLSQEHNIEKSKAKEVLLHSLALFSCHNAATGNSSEFSTPNLQISNPVCKKKSFQMKLTS
ncbi:TLR adapter interacting with SLC15A4 on the lysosome [Alligator mississippiensis]|uniref:TLR adapter interacting with SLC15A4 on the lysosome n=1 Tax=Alligator mississippiensis TaxID=8496 RepID=UPI0003D0AC99|nr:TLR adapter interacting with SLC15A4 on the lysosome [Alligator mississippiensis]